MFGGSRLLFPTKAGTVYSKSGFRSVWLPALLAAGFAHQELVDGEMKIITDLTFHMLRHTACSLMARAGMAPELIADRVGHSDGGALIYRRYRHLFRGEARAAVSLVDDLVAAHKANESSRAAESSRTAGQDIEPYILPNGP